MNCYSLFNVQGLCPQTKLSKVSYIKDTLYEKNLTFIALTETWLSDQHLQAELDIAGYTMFRADRNREKAKHGRHGGGVCLYVRDDLASTFQLAISFSNGAVDLLAVHSKVLELVIVIVYRKPDQLYSHRSVSTHFIEALDLVDKYLSSIKEVLPNVILCGDFNLPHARWSDGTSSRSVVGEERKMIDALLNFGINYGLSQCITSPTHFQGNILDLVFVNNEYLCHHFKCINVSKEISHHKIVEVHSTFMFGKSNVQKETPPAFKGLHQFNFFDDSICWDDVNKALQNYDWVTCFDGLDVDSMTEKFIEVSESICSLHIPVKFVSPGSKQKIPRRRKILMRKRRKLNKQLGKINISEARRSKLRLMLIEVEKSILKSHSLSQANQEKKAVESIKKNKKYFYSYVNKLSKTVSKVGPLITDNEVIVSESEPMANLLSKQFSSVFSPQTGTIPPAHELFPDADFIDSSATCLKDIVFDYDDIIKAINELSFTSAPGPDGYSPVLLKNCARTLCYPLYLIYRESLDKSVFPKSLKIGNITPIFKSGSRGKPANYRPVALTSHLSKVLEKIVRNQMLDYFESSNLLNDKQHGFRRGRSCISQLLAHFEKIMEELQKGSNVDVIYLDFSKAFDKLDFKTLLLKLKRYGISSKLGRWLYSFLIGRKQYVTVNGFASLLCFVLSGVPQGSVLGPLLFIIFINDVDRDVAVSFLSSFADDTRIGLGVKNDEDRKTLQSDLEAVYSWARNNTMVLNSSKFELLQYGSCESSYLYTDSNGESITAKDSVKDLGIYMSSSAEFSTHINSVVKKVTGLTSWALRCFKCRSSIFIITIWKTVILPHLDYGSQLWSPYKKCEIQKLEILQKCFLSKIVGTHDLSYWEILKTYGIYSLQRRRERYRIIYVWSILEGLVPNPKPGAMVSKFNPRLGRSCSVPVVKSGPFHKQVYSSFVVQGGMLFNCIPMEIRNLTNCNKAVFKVHLDNFLKTVPDEPQISGYTAIRRAETNSLLDMVLLNNA